MATQAVAATGSPADNRLPFRYGVRESHAPLVEPTASVAYSAGDLFSFKLNRVGAANAIELTFDGTLTTTTGHVPDYRSPFSTIGSMQLGASVGSTQLYDLDGWGTRLIWPTYKSGLDLTRDARIYARPASGANTAATLRFSLIIPVAMNRGEQFEIGTLLLQTPDVDVNLTGRFGTLADLGNNVTACTGTLRASMTYFEFGSPQQYQFPRLSLARWITNKISINGTGEVRFQLPRFGAVHNVVLESIINGAPADALDEIDVVFQRTAFPYRYRIMELRVEEARKYGNFVAPTGVHYLDFYHAFDRTNTGDLRDALDPEAMSTMEIVVNIPSTTSLGSNNNFLVARTRCSMILGS